MNTQLNYINNWPERAKDANWSASTLAKKCDVSLRTLQRYFLSSMNKSPREWLVEQRQIQASELLRQGLSVKQVASKLGFRYPHHLSREFKKYWGHCPVKKMVYTSVGH